MPTALRRLSAGDVKACGLQRFGCFDRPSLWLDGLPLGSASRPARLVGSDPPCHDGDGDRRMLCGAAVRDGPHQFQSKILPLRAGVGQGCTSGISQCASPTHAIARADPGVLPATRQIDLQSTVRPWKTLSTTRANRSLIGLSFARRNRSRQYRHTPPRVDIALSQTHGSTAPSRHRKAGDTAQLDGAELDQSGHSCFGLFHGQRINRGSSNSGGSTFRWHRARSANFPAWPGTAVASHGRAIAPHLPGGR